MDRVRKQCPSCQGRGILEICRGTQYAESFDLDDPEDLATKLDEDQMRSLAERLRGEWFTCMNCDRKFLLKEEREKREKLARELFGSES